MSTKQFIRLPARRRGVIRRASIWDAGDYLLSISGTSFSERYRRFYYDDIKAIVLQKGPRLGSIGALIFTLWFSIPFISFAFVPNSPAVFRWLWLIPLVWFIWLIYVNLARSCRVFIYTAVSSEELPAIFRRSAAAKALPKILNKIAAAQGDFTGAQVIAESTASRSISNAPAAEEQATPVSRQILYAVGIFCGLFLASAGFAYWYRDASWMPSNLLFAKIIFPVLNAMEVGSGVWGLFKLAGIRLMNSLRICIFAGLGALALRTYSLVFLISLISQRNGVVNDALSRIHLRYWVGTVDCALSTIIAIAGLISLILSWQDDRQVPATAQSRGPLSSL